MSRPIHERISGPERKRQFLEAFQANKHITISALSWMTGDSVKTIENALYADGRYPSMWHLYVIEYAIRRSNGRMPRDLGRTITLYKSRIRRFCNKTRAKHRYKPELIGGRQIPPRRKYIYYGELMTTSAIAWAAKIEGSGASHFFRRNFSPGDDVTAAVEYKIKTGRFSKNNI